MATGGGWSPWTRAGCVMFLRVSSVWDRNDLQAQRSVHISVSSAFITLLESQRSEVTPADSQLIVSSSQDPFRWIWRNFDWINWILPDERPKQSRDIRDELILCCMFWHRVPTAGERATCNPNRRHVGCSPSTLNLSWKQTTCQLWGQAGRWGQRVSKYPAVWLELQSAVFSLLVTFLSSSSSASCCCTNNCSWISWSRQATTLQQDTMKQSQFWSQITVWTNSVKMKHVKVWSKCQRSRGSSTPDWGHSVNRSKVKVSGKEPGWVCTELLLWRAAIYGEFYRLKLRKWSGVTHWHTLYTQYNTIHTTQPCRCVNLSVCAGWKHQVQ